MKAAHKVRPAAAAVASSADIASAADDDDSVAYVAVSAAVSC
jgi:hypothetical protein